MSKKQDILARLRSSGVVAVVRTDQPGDLIEVGRALAKGGVSFLEITMTVPKALTIIEQAVDALKEQIVIGVGTVLDAETARAAILAGAGYVVSPAMRPAVIEVCRRYDVVCMPGGMTPTEVLQAWELGADVVKVFPGSVGGPQFLKHLKGPFPFIELMTTGTVNQENAAQFIKAGACAVGIGGELVGNQTIVSREFDRITQNARAFIEIVKNARAEKP
jgi:2-dehydro-3-deoxyphosphogluconate aldolase/(4S)-4-hydroxy-2-oxoglutarate aldolase